MFEYSALSKTIQLKSKDKKKYYSKMKVYQKNVEDLCENAKKTVEKL